MAFKSEAHRAKCLELVQQGKMRQETFDKMEQESGSKLPERVSPRRDPKGPLKVSVKELDTYLKRRFGLGV